MNYTIMYHWKMSSNSLYLAVGNSKKNNVQVVDGNTILFNKDTILQ